MARSAVFLTAGRRSKLLCGALSRLSPCGGCVCIFLSRLGERSGFKQMTWERFHTGGCNPPAINCVVVGERCDSLRSHFRKTQTYVSGVTVALLIPNQLVRVRILGDVLFKIDNMVLWSNGYDTCLTCRKRWFDSIQDYLRLDTPTGRATRFKPECLQVRILL